MSIINLIRRGAYFLWKQIRSSFALLLYVTKYLNKRSVSKAKDPDPISPILSSQNSAESSSAEVLEESGIELNNSDNLIEKPERIKISSQGMRRLSLLFPVIFSVLFIFGFGGSFYYYYLFHQNSKNISSAQKGGHVTKSTTTQSPKRHPLSLQPPLDLNRVKGLMRTVNPQFLVEIPPYPVHRVAIILYNVGINQHDLVHVFGDFPEEVALSISPYADGLRELIDDLSALGHKIMLQMPWEDEDPFTDQGSLTIRTRFPQETLLSSLKALNKLADGTHGFYAEGGSRLLRRSEELSTTLKFIKQHRNCLIAPPDVLLSQLHELSAQIGLNYVSTTLVNPTLDRFSQVVSLANRSGFAILAFSMCEESITEILKWIKRLKEAKIEVVPITEIIDKPEQK